MAIMLEPKSRNGFATESNPTYDKTISDLPLGQRPEGDQFEQALLKLENVFHTLNSRLGALEENLKKFEEGQKKLEYHVFNLVNANKPLILTKDMEVKKEKDGHQ